MRKNEQVINIINQGLRGQALPDIQSDYSILWSMALSDRFDGQGPSFKRGTRPFCSFFAAYLDCSPLRLHFMQNVIQIPAHGPGDICLIENTSDGTFVLLWGENQKKSLDRGVVDFDFQIDDNPENSFRRFLSPYFGCISKLKAEYQKGYPNDDSVPHWVKIDTVRPELVRYSTDTELQTLYKRRISRHWGKHELDRDGVADILIPSS